MELFNLSTPAVLTRQAKDLCLQERQTHKILNGWFLAKEIAADAEAASRETHPELRAAEALEAIVEKLPIELSEHAILAGTQRDALPPATR